MSGTPIAGAARFSQRRLLLQTAVSWFTVLTEIVTGFLLAPILIRTLGPEKYGVWVVFNSTHSLCNLVDLGLRGTFNRVVSMAGGRKEVDGLTGTIIRVLLLGAMASTVIHLAVGLLFPTLFPKAPPLPAVEIVVALGLMSINVYSGFASSSYTAYLAATGRNHEATAISAALNVIRIPAVLLLVQFTHSLIALAALFAGLGLLQVTALKLRSRGLANVVALVRQPPDWPALKKVRGHASFSFMSRSAYTFYAELPTYAAMLLLGSSSVALLAFCFLLISFSRRLIEAFGSNVFPLVMRACAQQDLAMLRKLFEVYLLYTSIIASLFYFGIFFYGGDFLRIWLAPQPFELDAALKVLALGALLGGIGGLSSIVLEGFGRYWRNLGLQLTEFVLNVLLVIVLAWALDLRELGIALAFVIPRALTAGVLLWMQSRAIAMSGELVGRLLLRNVTWWAVAAGCVALWHRWLPPRDWPTLLVSAAGAGLSFLALVGWFHRDRLIALRRGAPIA